MYVNPVALDTTATDVDPPTATFIAPPHDAPLVAHGVPLTVTVPPTNVGVNATLLYDDAIVIV